ncbi:Electron transfer DM13 [Actinokineospora terrae]|uniref:Electron transfer DM13 n=1 Tax=Actinokineospora terrae TaxID=155974 RepID=A0A1H9PBI2_9PSEU|nr:Electron transfer DM13 [Actinokineospora terrae]
MHRSLRRKAVWGGIVAVTVAVAVGLWLFQPWRLVTRSSVDEALPFTTPAAVSTTAAVASTTAVPVNPPGPKVLAEGTFVSQEHPTRGTARILEQDGTRVLRLENFSTSDGPDVHVWLSATPAAADWHAYDDIRYVPLGDLKATDGNQNYPIPADADLTDIRSTVIWCDRFNVAFGSAPLVLG